jgi:vacuolar-type H+-ATPase subunit I/STV1
MDLIKQAFKSKTIWFAIILALLSVVQGYLHLFNLEPVHQALVGSVVAVAVAVLRIVTTMPLNQK